MKKYSFTSLLFVIMAFYTSLAFCQGTLTGVISDSLTNEALVGAEVYFLGTAIGTVTNVNGEYRIDGVPAKSYDVRISYIGYHPKTVSINIKVKEITVLNIQLLPGTIEGEVIQITAQLEGQAAAINQQIRSKTIINVVSEEKIQELPDVNAAESIGRLPGVSIKRSGGEANKIVMRGLSDKYSTITIDGVRIASTDEESRGVDLSTISQGSLAGIELYKALTPDMDADAIAGSVNLVTKKAPDQRLLRFDSRGSYNQLNNTYNQYDFNLRYGERFYKDIIGVQVSGNLEKKDRSKENEDIDYNYQLASWTDYRVDDFNLRYTDETRDRMGFSVLLDANTPDGGSIRFNNVFNKTKRSYIEHVRDYPALGSPIYNYRDRDQEIQTYTGSLAGDNYLFGITAKWGLSYAMSKSAYPFDFKLSFTEAGDANDPPSGMRLIPESLWHGPPEAYIDYAYNNFNKTTLDTAFYRDEHNSENEKNIFINLAKNYTIGNSFSGELKIGGKYLQRSRDRSLYEEYAPYWIWSDPFFEYTYESGRITRKDFSGTRFDNLALVNGLIVLSNFLDKNPVNRKIYGNADLYPLINADALREWWKLNRHGLADSSFTNPEYGENPEARARFYDVTERISAGYLMNTLNYKKLVTFIAGLRIENENNSYAAKYTPYASGGFPWVHLVIRDTSAVHNETILLPNFHIAIKPVEFLNVRLVAYEALVRPDFNQRLPNSITKARSTAFPGNNWYLGNTGLKAAKAWNFEVNTAAFSSKIGLFSVSLFYKDIKDMFQSMNGLAIETIDDLRQFGVTLETSPYPNDPFVLWYTYNSKKTTWVKGIEVEHQTNFRYLPGLWKNIVLSYNFSIIRSLTYVPYLQEYTIPQPPPFPPLEKNRPAERKAKLEGQPEFFGNFSVGYDLGGFSIRFSVFHQGEYYTSYLTNDQTGTDKTADSFTRLDLAIKQQITRNISVMLNINNLTDVVESTTNHQKKFGWDLLSSSEKYGRTADLGLRISL